MDDGLTALDALINQHAARLVHLAMQFAAQHGERHELEFERVEISRWRIVIHMRPKPAVVEMEKQP
ncbi:MAG: hypothetical protein IPM49_18500 [Flavobacteriales bacterium]|nr:hypothetical protein [Flavobacteriales bacterium]